jgi:hypothetical protein
MDFQLPLSGSLIAIDVDGVLADTHSAVFTFNSLSRDHRFVKWLEAVGQFADFQLPLSGSPSPIPGFFGSPRLSAAAPFRTNDS